MNRWIYLLVLALFGSGVALSAAEESHPHYIQLIRGNDQDQPPVPGARRIGPVLSKSLHSVFRWKNYWEVSRHEVRVTSGSTTNLVLSPERAVEIDLRTPNKRKVTAFSDKKPVGTTTQHISTTMAIIGADRDRNSAWFVVVRQDRPSLE